MGQRGGALLAPRPFRGVLGFLAAPRVGRVGVPGRVPSRWFRTLKTDTGHGVTEGQWEEGAAAVPPCLQNKEFVLLSRSVNRLWHH